MTYYYLAFFMGFFSSIHCAVMCGPLVVAIQGNQGVSWKQTFNKLLYQFGRILTYGVLGLSLGLVGSLAAVQGWQQGFSLLTGAILILIGLACIFAKNSKTFAQFQVIAIQPFVRVMGRWLYRPGGAFVAGILNGILPCGMVYMALVSAMNASSIEGSFQFMLLFGIGTLPLMLLFSVASLWIKKRIKVRFATLVPVLYLLMGIWFILRGANLDLPYLSPFLRIEGAINCA